MNIIECLVFINATAEVQRQGGQKGGGGKGWMIRQGIAEGDMKQNGKMVRRDGKKGMGEKKKDCIIVFSTAFRVTCPPTKPKIC